MQTFAMLDAAAFAFLNVPLGRGLQAVRAAHLRARQAPTAFALPLQKPAPAPIRASASHRLSNPFQQGSIPAKRG